MASALTIYERQQRKDELKEYDMSKSATVVAYERAKKGSIAKKYNDIYRQYQATQSMIGERKSYFDGNDDRIMSSAQKAHSMASALMSDMEIIGYDGEDKKTIFDNLQKMQSANSSVIDLLSNEKKFYSQFTNEAAYNAWKAQSEKLKSFEAMTADELEQAMEDKRSEREAYTQENGSKFINQVGRLLVNLGYNSKHGAEVLDDTKQNTKNLDDIDTEIQLMQNVLNEKKIVENAKQLEKLPQEVLAAVDTIVAANEIERSSIFRAWATGNADVASGVTDYGKQEAIQTLQKMGYTDWENLVEMRRNAKNAENANQLKERTQQFTENHPVLSNVAAVGANVVRGASIVSNVLDTVSGQEIDINDPMHSFGAFADTVRSTTQEDIQSTAGKIAYQVGIVAADNLVRMGIGKIPGGSAKTAAMIAGAIMSSQVLSQAVVEGKAKGYSNKKALTMGIIQAAIEGATEKWSVETILGNPKNVFLQVGKSFLAEGSEELASNWLNRIAEIIADDDIDDLRTRMNNYKMEGMSDSEAMTHAVFDLMKDDGQAFLVGGLSGALLGAGNATRVTAAESAYRNFEGQSIIDDGNVQELLDAAKLSDDKATKKLAQKVEKNGKAGNVGKLAQNVEADAHGRMDSIVERYKNGEPLNAFELTAMRRNSDAMQSLLMDGVPSRRIAQEAGDIGYKALQSYAEQYKETGAEQAFLQGYKAGQDVDYYAKSFAATYQAGVDGKSLAKISEAVETNDSFTQEQAIEAHKAGYMEGMTYASEPFDTIQIENDTAKAIAAAELKPGVTLVNMGEDTELDSVTRTQLSVIQNLGKEKGIAFAIVDNYSGNYDQYNGLQLGGTNKIVISLQAEQGLLLRTAGHETFHYIKQQNAEAAERLQNFVVDYFMKNGKYEALATEYAKNGCEDNIDEEMTADSLFDVMQTKEFIAHYTQTDAQTQKGLKNSVEAFLRHVKQALKRLTLTNRTHRIIAESLQKDKKALEKIRSLFMDALDGIHADDDVKQGMDNRKSRKRPEKYPWKYSPYHKGIDNEYAGKYNGIWLEPLEYGRLSSQIKEMYSAMISRGESVPRSDIVYLADTYYEIINNNPYSSDNFTVVSRFEYDKVFEEDIENENAESKRYDRDTERSNKTSETFGSRDGSVLLRSEEDSDGGESTGDGQVSAGESESDSSGNHGQSIRDLRYSVKPQNAIAAENRKLTKENEHLKKIVEQLRAEKTIFKKYTPKPGAVEKLTRRILKEKHSSMPKDELYENLVAIYSFMNQDMQTNQDFDFVMETATNVAKCILEQSESKDTTLTEEYKDMRDRLRKGGFTLTETQKMEMRAQFGDLGAFMRRNFGKVQYRTDGIELDEVWDELSTLWPEFFNPDTNEADMPMRLLDAYEATSPMYINPYGMDIDAAAQDLAIRIIEGNFDVPEWKTWAMRNKESREKLIAEQNAWRKQMQQQYKQNIQKVRTEERKRGLDKLWKERERAKEKNAEVVRKAHEMLLEQRARQAAALQARNDRSERAKMKKQIMQTCTSLSHKLAKNSSKKNIPLVLQEPVIGLLKSISAYESTERVTTLNKKFVENMRKVYECMDDGRHNQWEEAYNPGDISDDLMDEIRQVRKKAEEVIDTYGNEKASILDMMNVTELKGLNQALTSLHAMANNAGILHQNAMYKDVESATTKSNEELFALQEKKVHIKPVEKVMEWVAWRNLTPQQFFKRLGSAAMTIFDELKDGQDKLAFRVREAEVFARSVMTEQEVKEWRKQVFTVHDAKGDKFDITADQIMSLYCLSRRDAARRHLFDGGITPGAVGKKQQSHSYKLNEAVLDDIIHNLSARQIEVADKLQEYMSTVCAEWGNEVSIRRYGILSFNETHYFPMAVDKNTVHTGDKPSTGINLFSLINKAFTKTVNEKASNPLYVLDIFDVFAKHTGEMAAYSSMAIPLLDALHWYDGVKPAIQHAYGAEAQQYFERLITDINGEADRDRTEFGWFMSSYKVSKVAANLNVALVQGTAYVRAANVMNPKYLMKALVKTTGIKDIKQHIDDMEKYCGIACWKALGFYDVDVSRGIAEVIRNDQSWRQKVQDKAMLGAEWADKITWGYLFYACQLETFQKGGLAFGSEAHKKSAAKLFRDVVYETQVVDSVLTRSDVMRSKTVTDKVFTAFMSEGTLSFNMVMERFSQIDKDIRSGMNMRQAVNKNASNLLRTFSVYAATAFATALLQSISGALRDDSDDDAVDKYLSKLKENTLEELSIAGKIPGIKIIPELFDAVRKGEEFVSSNVSEDMLKDISKAFKGFTKGFLWYNNVDGVIYGNTYALLVAISSASGLPVSNMTRDVVAMWNATVGEAKPEYKIRRRERTDRELIDELSDMGDIEAAIFVEKILEKDIEAKKKKGEKGTEDELRKSAVSDLKSSISRKAHLMYLAGEVEQSKELMRKCGLYASDEISKKIKEWSKKAS